MVHVATPPDPNPKKPKFAVPPGAVDTHLHLFGPLDRYKFTPDTPFVPAGEALPETCIAMHKAIGISHGVIVSSGAYGRDNSHMLDTLERFGEHFRGVCVPPRDLPRDQIASMDRLGVRGIRFIGDAGGNHVAKIEVETARRVADFGWHVQFIAQKTNLVDHADRLMALPNTVVLDHFGIAQTELGVSQPAFQTVLRMLESGRVWVKMSGPVYCSKQEFPYSDLQPFAEALVRAAPDRLVWATDWPHLHMYDRKMPNDGGLLDLLADWVPDESVRNRILADNPARLYGFTPPSLRL